MNASPTQRVRFLTTCTVQAPGGDTFEKDEVYEMSPSSADHWITRGLAEPVADESGPGATIDATAGAIKLAEEHEVDLSGLTGTGKDGRITADDVKKHLDEN